MRFTHFTPWIDDENFGYSIFDPSHIHAGACAVAPTFCGFEWQAKDSPFRSEDFPPGRCSTSPGLVPPMTCSEPAIPFFVAAGDGSITTPVSSPTAWMPPLALHGEYRAQQLVRARLPARILPAVHRCLLPNLSCMNVAATPASPSAVDSKDDKQPYTDSWSFTVSQRTPWQSRLEVAYVGNRSRDLPNGGGFGSNLNLVPVGRDAVHPIPAMLIPILPALE